MPRQQRCRRGHDDWYYKPDGGRYCRTCQLDLQKDRRRAAGRQYKPARPKLTAAWKEARRRGIAGDLCDRIVQARDVPPALAWLYINAATLESDRLVPKRSLTYQERRILYLLSFGWEQPDVARFLKVSLATVIAQVRSLQAALGVTTTAEAVAVAFRRREIT